MQLIGFNFKKINIEKFSNEFEKLKINTNINISKIDKIKMDFLKSKEDVIMVEFKYEVNYDPNIAKIEFIGDILFTTDQKQLKEIIKDWKNKKMSENFKIILFNIILRRSSIKALQLEEGMNLPPHIPLPNLKKNKNKEN